MFIKSHQYKIRNIGSQPIAIDATNGFYLYATEIPGFD